MLKTRQSFTVEAPLERVSRALVSAGYLEEEGRTRVEIAAASYRPGQRSSGRVEFEVRYREWRRTRLGKLDRSGTTNGVARSVWDPRARKLCWDYSTDASRRFRLSGVYRLEAAPEGTRVVHEIEINVRFPLVGRRIERFVARRFAEDIPRVQQLLLKHATACRRGSS